MEFMGEVNITTNEYVQRRRLSYTAAFKFKVEVFAENTNNSAAQQKIRISDNLF